MSFKLPASEVPTYVNRHAPKVARHWVKGKPPHGLPCPEFPCFWQVGEGQNAGVFDSASKAYTDRYKWMVEAAIFICDGGLEELAKYPGHWPPQMSAMILARWRKESGQIRKSWKWTEEAKARLSKTRRRNLPEPGEYVWTWQARALFKELIKAAGGRPWATGSKPKQWWAMHKGEEIPCKGQWAAMRLFYRQLAHEMVAHYPDGEAGLYDRRTVFPRYMADAIEENHFAPGDDLLELYRLPSVTPMEEWGPECESPDYM